MIRKKTEIKGLNKAAIIEEYLSGENTLKSLGEKYGIPDRTIQSWVRSYRKSRLENEPEPPKEKISELQSELERLKLKNELLEEIIKLSEKETGIALRKKFGPKQ